jgi:hypothetical protein
VDKSTEGHNIPDSSKKKQKQKQKKKQQKRSK